MQKSEALGLVVSEKKTFCVFPIISLWQIITPPGSGLYKSKGMGGRAGLAEYIKRTTIHGYTHHMKALGLVSSEKKIFIFIPL